MIYELAETVNLEHLCLRRIRRYFWLHHRVRISTSSPVFISGTGFTGDATVMLGNTPCTPVTLRTDNQIVCTVSKYNKASQR